MDDPIGLPYSYNQRSREGGKNEMSAICVGLKETINYIQYFPNWVLLTLLYMFDKLSSVYLCHF
jgi:hypothetical protein